MEYIKHQSYAVPVDICTKQRVEEICWPDTGDKLKDIYILLKMLSCDLDQVKVNLHCFQ